MTGSPLTQQKAELKNMMPWRTRTGGCGGVESDMGTRAGWGKGWDKTQAGLVMSCLFGEILKKIYILNKFFLVFLNYFDVLVSKMIFKK